MSERRLTRYFSREQSEEQPSINDEAGDAVGIRNSS